MAKFEKGHIKKGGRPTGKPNKTTEQLREFWQLLLEKNEERIAQELGALEGKDFLDAVFKMTEYVIPKLQRMELTGDNGGPVKYIIKRVDESTGDTD